jgi:hypothetical protein
LTDERFPGKSVLWQYGMGLCMGGWHYSICSGAEPFYFQISCDTSFKNF